MGHSQTYRMTGSRLLFCFFLFSLVISALAETKRFKRWSSTHSCSYCGGQSYSQSYSAPSSSCSYCGSSGYVSQPSACSSGCYGSSGGSSQAFSRGKNRGKKARGRLGNLLQAAAGFAVGVASGGSGGCGSGGCGSSGYSSGCGSGGCGSSGHSSGGYNSGGSGGSTVIIVRPSSGSSRGSSYGSSHGSSYGSSHGSSQGSYGSCSVCG